MNMPEKTKSAKKECAKREKPVRGSWVAKNILQFLRDFRKSDARSIHALKYARTEEIEWWEDMIRATVKGRRREPREILELDSATVAALDEIFLHGRHHSQRDGLEEYRRKFALRMIRAGCEAAAQGEDPHLLAFCSDFAVELRDMTEEEKQAECLAQQIEEQEDPV
jgi:tRNA(Ile)-lysidine synthase TilS/MesJ